MNATVWEQLNVGIRCCLIVYNRFELLVTLGLEPYFGIYGGNTKQVKQINKCLRQNWIRTHYGTCTSKKTTLQKQNCHAVASTKITDAFCHRCTQRAYRGRSRCACFGRYSYCTSDLGMNSISTGFRKQEPNFRC